MSKTHPATDYGVNTFFTGRLKMDLRNGITWDVLMGYEWNLVLKTPCDSEPVRRCLTPSESWMTLNRQLGVMAPKLHKNRINTGKWRTPQPNSCKREIVTKIKKNREKYKVRGSLNPDEHRITLWWPLSLTTTKLQRKSRDKHQKVAYSPA